MTEKEIFEYLSSRKMLLFYAVRGSHLYGTNIETSDVDHHGIFTHPVRSYAGLNRPKEDFLDEKSDTSVYELRKYMNLATTANPTVLDMMWTPEKYIIFESEVSKKFFSKRNMFITKKCFFSFCSYAREQLKKARGANKKVMSEPKYLHMPGIDLLKNLLKNDLVSSEWVEMRFSKDFLKFLVKGTDAPLTENTSFKKMDEYLSNADIVPLIPPQRNQYCFVISDKSGIDMPFRPVPLLQTGIKLEECNCSSIEHLGYAYRLYHYGDNANGIFKGGEIFYSSIPKEDEKEKCIGILIYAKQEYESARGDWKSFFEWMANRNECRWHSEDSNKNFEYDRKNMQHTIRLLLSAENIAKEGIPIIKFSGEKLSFLRDIRSGKFDYDYLMNFANEKVLSLEKEFAQSDLPDACNMKEVNSLFEEILDILISREIG